MGVCVDAERPRRRKNSINGKVGMTHSNGAGISHRKRSCGTSFRPQLPAAAILTVVLWGFNTVVLAGGLDGAFFFNIPAQPMDKALLKFGAQAHVQLSVSLDPIEARVRTRNLHGHYTGKQALHLLLAGTDLRYSVHGRTVDIRQARPALAVPATGESERSRLSQHSTVRSKPSQMPSPSSNDPPTTTGGKDTSLLREIIVTAQKYSQRAFDVPISLQVVSGQELAQYGITDLSSLQYDVPGLYMDNTGTQRAVFLRGVGNYLGNGSMVGQYIDEADITAQGSQGGTLGYDTGTNGLYDLDRVEVLKGPQGTLYGDGSMGGVIRYITNRPALDRFQASEDVSASFTESGAPSQDIEAMLNTPLVQDTLGLRIAGIFQHNGGWVDEPAANLDDINGENLADVRAEILWQPTPRLAVNGMQTVHRDTSGIGAGEDAGGSITPLFGTTFVPNMADNSTLSNLTVTYDFDVARLLSSTTYSGGEQNIYEQAPVESIPGSPIYWILEPYFHVDNSDASEELRLVHTGEGSWQWSVGGFYKAYREYLAFPGEYLGVAGQTLAEASEVQGEDAADSSRSWAGFADTSYKPFRRLTLGAGVRYFKDRETQWTVTDGSILPNSASLGPNVLTPFSPETFKSTDPRFYLQYQVTSHVSTYATASKGFRSGGPNQLPSEPPYQPESLWSYDLGVKIRYPEEGIRADVDVFDMNYSNFVSFTYVPPQTQLIEDANIGKARIRGVDADLTWRPVEQWTLGLNTEVLHSEFLTASVISGYAPGNRLPFAPAYSFTGSIDRDFHFAGRPGDAEVYYYEISRVQFRLAGVPLYQSDVLRFLSARADIQWTDSVALGVFAHNLLNDRGNVTPLWWSGDSTRPRPRTVGVEIKANFGG